jgi:hypothetical protein
MSKLTVYLAEKFYFEVLKHFEHFDLVECSYSYFGAMYDDYCYFIEVGSFFTNSSFYYLFSNF